jgi:hypothetical protein
LNMSFLSKWFLKKEYRTDEKSTNDSTPKTCAHSWKDFPWYIKSIYYTDVRELKAEIYEPYVCIYCRQREDKLLEKFERSNVTREQATTIVNETVEQYKDYIKPRAIVEDMIHDFKLVDPTTLYYYEMLHKSTPKTKFTTPSSIRISTPAPKDELQ